MVLENLRSFGVFVKITASISTICSSSKINAYRVANRHAQGGHDVPSDKIVSRYTRSIAQLKEALPYLSRAFVFDNSGSEMRFLGEYDAELGWTFSASVDKLPSWFVQAI